jgi:membrane protein YdbS with pleckstrin-like domain
MSATNEVSSTKGLRLHDGERVVMDVQPSQWWTLGRYVFTLGLWAIWRKRNHYVLTSERIIHFKGIISKTERSAPLARIQDAQLNRSPLTGGKLVLSTAGGSLGFNTIGPLTQADALAFHDALMPLLGATRQGV